MVGKLMRVQNRPSRDQWAMEVAIVTSYRATCIRRKVGCVFLNKLGHIIATGYNGVAAGTPHCNETTMDIYLHPHIVCSGRNSQSGTNLDGCQAIHAEQNALLQCSNVQEIDIAYITTSPCMTCVKMLLNTGCTTIVYHEEYQHTDARQLWESVGRSWVTLQNR